MFPSDEEIKQILTLSELNPRSTQSSLARRLKIHQTYISRIFKMRDYDILDDFIDNRRKKRALRRMKTIDVGGLQFQAERLAIRKLLGIHDPPPKTRRVKTA